MIKIIKKLSIGLGVALLMVSCSKDMDDVNPSSTLGGMSVDAAKAKSVTAYSFSTLRTSDGMTWSFDVQRSGDHTGSNANTVVLGLFGCDGEPLMLSGANVTSLSVSGANGTQQLALSFADGSNNACSMAETPNYVSFSNFDANLKTNTVYTFTLTLNSAIQVTSANAGVRAGNDCFAGTMEGPGCDEMDICGEGQGYFHKSEHWGDIATVTIGGHVYTAAEAVTLITSDKKEGGSDNKGGIADSKAAFAQGVTVLLNRQLGWISQNAYAAQLADINAYLSTLDNLTTYEIDDMPTGNAAAKAAAGYIGDNIDCDEE